MLNYIWLGLIVAAVLIGGFEGRIKELVEGVVRSAESAVTLALGLIGLMAVWLGLMRLAEKAGIVQAGIGKASFTEEKLVQNVKALADAVSKAKPAGSKGTYIQRVAVSSTMGPGVKVEPGTLLG